MGLINTLKRAEEQARKAARSSAERAIVGLDDAERAIRRRMRVYPKQMPALRTRPAMPAQRSPSPARQERQTTDKAA